MLIHKRQALFCAFYYFILKNYVMKRRKLAKTEKKCNLAVVESNIQSGVSTQAKSHSFERNNVPFEIPGYYYDAKCDRYFPLSSKKSVSFEKDNNLISISSIKSHRNIHADFLFNRSPNFVLRTIFSTYHNSYYRYASDDIGIVSNKFSYHPIFGTLISSKQKCMILKNGCEESVNISDLSQFSWSPCREFDVISGLDISETGNNELVIVSRSLGIRRKFQLPRCDVRLAWKCDGEYLYVLSEKKILAYEMKSNRLLECGKLPEKLSEVSCNFSNRLNSNLLHLGHRNGSLSIFDSRSLTTSVIAKPSKDHLWYKMSHMVMMDDSRLIGQDIMGKLLVFDCRMNSVPVDILSPGSNRFRPQCFWVSFDSSAIVSTVQDSARVGLEIFYLNPSMPNRSQPLDLSLSLADSQWIVLGNNSSFAGSNLVDEDKNMSWNRGPLTDLVGSVGSCVGEAYFRPTTVFQL